MLYSIFKIFIHHIIYSLSLLGKRLHINSFHNLIRLIQCMSRQGDKNVTFHLIIKLLIYGGIRCRRLRVVFLAISLWIGLLFTVTITSFIMMYSPWIDFDFVNPLTSDIEKDNQAINRTGSSISVP